MQTYGFLILAAGSSSRLGRPKQLLQVGEVNLLQHTINQSLALQNGPVFVVLGSQAEDISRSLNSNNITAVMNASWKDGMASSIRSGIFEVLHQDPLIDAIICMVCDQPYLSKTHLQRLIDDATASGKGIVASTYKDTAGTPVLFTKKYFPELLALQGNEGAKKIIGRNPEDVHLVPFPKGEIDIDTPDQYARFLQQSNP